MLTRIRFKNFKTWGLEPWEPGIELAPISIFLGPNSAGKTSILQLPLLLKQTFESPDRNLDLNLGGQTGDLVDLGMYESLIHNHDISSELGIGLVLEPGAGSGKGAEIRYSATFRQLAGAPVIQRLELAGNGRTFSAERQAKGGYLLKGPSYEAPRVGTRKEAKRTYQPERSLAFSPDAVAALGPLGPEVQDLSLRFRQAVGQIAYLGPLRERPERSYLWSNAEPNSIGTRGEYCVHALLASENARTRRKPGQEGGQRWLVERVSYWLSQLGVADELRLARQGRSRHYSVVVVQGRQEANLIDVGFGVSQVLPMLVLAHIVPSGTTIIAEQPEIHLHPLAQVGLAELMAEVARTREVQFLVETHSEHLFRRLQTLIALEKQAAEACRLYFVDRGPSGHGAIQRLQVDGFGRVSNWPKNFFGDTLGETETQTRKMLERLAKRRESSQP